MLLLWMSSTNSPPPPCPSGRTRRSGHGKQEHWVQVLLYPSSVFFLNTSLCSFQEICRAKCLPHIFSFHWIIINDQVAPHLCQYLASSLKVSLFEIVVDCPAVLQVEAKCVRKKHNPRQFLGQMEHLSLSTVVGWETRSLGQLNHTVQIQVL